MNSMWNSDTTQAIYVKFLSAVVKQNMLHRKEAKSFYALLMTRAFSWTSSGAPLPQTTAPKMRHCAPCSLPNDAHWGCAAQPHGCQTQTENELYQTW